MLVVFDLDGTLLRTAETDADAYAQAFDDVFGIRMAPADWESCRHVTDQGIAVEVVQRRLGRPAREDELASMKQRFLALLADRLPTDGAALQVPGVVPMLARLWSEGIGVAVATGAWSDSAFFKIHRAGLPVSTSPLATCDDHPSREEIMQIALDRAAAVRPFERVVYVGDGPWDVVACANMGVPFIGIDHARSGRLGQEGTVLPDFLDADRFLETVWASARPAKRGDAALAQAPAVRHNH